MPITHKQQQQPAKQTFHLNTTNFASHLNSNYVSNNNNKVANNCSTQSKLTKGKRSTVARQFIIFSNGFCGRMCCVLMFRAVQH